MMTIYLFDNEHFRILLITCVWEIGHDWIGRLAICVKRDHQGFFPNFREIFALKVQVSCIIAFLERFFLEFCFGSHQVDELWTASFLNDNKYSPRSSRVGCGGWGGIPNVQQMIELANNEFSVVIGFSYSKRLLGVKKISKKICVCLSLGYGSVVLRKGWRNFACVVFWQTIMFLCN